MQKFLNISFQKKNFLSQFNIPDKSLVGGKVPKCITSQLAQLKILLVLYILFQLIKTLPNIKCM